jgi:hypothetical protein
MHDHNTVIAKRAQGLLAVACLLAVLAAGCNGERICGCHPPGPKPRPPYSPDKLWNVLEATYEDRDIARYRQLLVDTYEFCIPERNWGAPEELTDTCLTKSMDVTSTQNMFQDPRIDSIGIWFSRAGMWTPCDEDTLVGLCCLFNVELRITTKKPIGATAGSSVEFVPSTWGDLKLFFANGGQAIEPGTTWTIRSQVYVMVIPDPVYAGLWALLRMDERPTPFW